VKKTRISGLMKHEAKDGTVTYYTHLRRGGENRWIRHGSDLGLAQTRHYELLSGQPAATPTELSMSDAVERWLESYCSTRRTPTFKKYTAARWALHGEAMLGDKPLVKVTSEDIRRWLGALSALSPQTQRHVLADVRCMFNWAVDEAGLLDKSPFPKHVMPRLQEEPPKRLSDGAVELALAVPEPYAFVVRLLLGTGLRWGEACRAQRAHVQGSVLTVYQTKSGKKRSIPLVNPVADPALVKDVQGRVGLLVPFSGSSHGSFAKAMLRHGAAPGFSVHKLRHTFACRYLEAGGDLPDLQKLLGHASIAMTQRYAELSDKHILDKCRRLAEAR